MSDNPENEGEQTFRQAIGLPAVKPAMPKNAHLNFKAKRELMITGCTDPQMWYADLIGERVPFVREDNEGYWSREPAGFLNIVHKDDAYVVAR